MPTSGSYLLSDVTADKVVIVCEQCQRRGEYATARLLEKHGPDIAMPDLKTHLVGTCGDSYSTNLVGCKARYAPETIASFKREG
ncbi:MAG TPA: hypothetical protein VGO22_19625 [Pseudorhizobium sp.]|nr:hypothetical protein [Pseudorhizobium sp.]